MITRNKYCREIKRPIHLLCKFIVFLTGIIVEFIFFKSGNSLFCILFSYRCIPLEIGYLYILN